MFVTALVLLFLFGTVIAARSGPDVPHLLSAVLGTVISFFVILAGYTANRWAFGRSPKQFLGTVVGGMLVRLAIVASLLVWVVRNVQLPLITFFIALTISYLVFQAVEVWTIHGQLKRGNF